MTAARRPADRQARDVADDGVRKALFQRGIGNSAAITTATEESNKIPDRDSRPRSRRPDLLQCSNER